MTDHLMHVFTNLGAATKLPTGGDASIIGERWSATLHKATLTISPRVFMGRKDHDLHGRISQELKSDGDPSRSLQTT